MKFTLPKLDNSNDFEELVRDVSSIKLKNPNLQRYGRSGQKQNGIDIVGIAGKDCKDNSGNIIQCKNHLEDIPDKDLCDEIDTELAVFEQSAFRGNLYNFSTSAKNSTKVIDHVNAINLQRKKDMKKPITISFWDDISRDVLQNQFILHKYYGTHLSIAKPLDFEIPDEGMNSRATLRLLLSDFENEENITHIGSQIKEVCVKNLGENYRPVEPYNLYLGISTSSAKNFNAQVDLDIDASMYFSSTEKLEEKYVGLTKSLGNLGQILQNSFFSKKIVVISDVEISLALLLGRVLRKYRLGCNVNFKNIFLTTESEDISYYPSKLEETFLSPAQQNNNDAEDLVFVVNMALQTNITNDVLTFVKDWDVPVLFRCFGLSNGNNMENSAHAASISDEVVSKLHNFQKLGIKRIHLFLATPKPLALLIGHKINTINSEVHLYFMSPDRTTYLKTGILKNNTF